MTHFEIRKLQKKIDVFNEKYFRTNQDIQLIARISGNDIFIDKSENGMVKFFYQSLGNLVRELNVAVATDLYVPAIVSFENRLEEICHRMPAKIRRDVAYSKSSIWLRLVVVIRLGQMCGGVNSGPSFVFVEEHLAIQVLHLMKAKQEIRVSLRVARHLLQSLFQQLDTLGHLAGLHQSPGVICPKFGPSRFGLDRLSLALKGL